MLCVLKLTELWNTSLLFDLNYKYIMGASLLALAKSIYYCFYDNESLEGSLLGLFLQSCTNLYATVGLRTRIINRLTMSKSGRWWTTTHRSNHIAMFESYMILLPTSSPYITALKFDY